MINHSCKSISFAKLTIPFETNISKNHNYKTNKYSNLILDIAWQGYNCKFLVIEIGSHGYIGEDNKDQIASLFHKLTKKENQKTNQPNSPK